MTPMGSNVELHRTVRERLSDREQRYTTGRRRIVDVLVAAEGPVTLPELLTKQPVLSQSSAYRNLSIMEEAGIVRRLVHPAARALRARRGSDPAPPPPHLQLGLIRDITLGPRLERSLDSAFNGVPRAPRVSGRDTTRSTSTATVPTAPPEQGRGGPS